MMSVFNEADIVGQTFDHLASQGIELVVVDNGSNDGSYEIIKGHIGNGVLSVKRVESEKYEPMPTLRLLHGMAIEYSPDWMLLTGADEFLESPYRGLTLSRAIQLEGGRGFNMIQFNTFEFFPTEKDDGSKEIDVRKRLRYYSWNDNYQYRCWKTAAGMPIFETHGHDSKLPGEIDTKISPNKFILRHYKIRSYEHGLRKVFSERLPRYSQEERKRGMYVHYNNFGTDRSYFVIDSSKLTRYDEDGNWNLAKTFDGSFGAWNPSSDDERITQLIRENRKLMETSNERIDRLIRENRELMEALEKSIALRLARRIPFGGKIRHLLNPKK